MNLLHYIQVVAENYLKAYPLLEKDAAFFHETYDVSIDVLRAPNIHWAGKLDAAQISRLTSFLSEVDAPVTVSEEQPLNLSVILSSLYRRYDEAQDEDKVEKTKKEFAEILNILDIPAERQSVFFNTTFNIMTTGLFPGPRIMGALYNFDETNPPRSQEYQVDVSVVQSAENSPQLQFVFSAIYRFAADENAAIVPRITFATEGNDNTTIKIADFKAVPLTVNSAELYAESLQKAKLTYNAIKLIAGEDKFNAETKVHSIEHFAWIVLNKILPAIPLDKEKQDLIVKILHDYLTDVYQSEELEPNIAAITEAFASVNIPEFIEAPVEGVTKDQQKILVDVANLKLMAQAGIKKRETGEVVGEAQKAAMLETTRGAFEVVFPGSITKQMDKNAYTFLTEHEGLWTVNDKTQAVTINYVLLSQLISSNEINMQQVQTFFTVLAQTTGLNTQAMLETINSSFTQAFNHVYSPVLGNSEIPAKAPWEPIRVMIEQKNMEVVYPALRYIPAKIPGFHSSSENEESSSASLSIELIGTGKPEEFKAVNIYKNAINEEVDFDFSTFLNTEIVGAFEEYYTLQGNNDAFKAKIGSSANPQILAVTLIDILNKQFLVDKKQSSENIREFFALFFTLQKLSDFFVGGGFNTSSQWRGLIQTPLNAFKANLQHKLAHLKHLKPALLGFMDTHLLDMMDSHLLAGDLESAKKIMDSLDDLDLIKRGSPAASLKTQIDVLLSKTAESKEALSYEHAYYKFMQAVTRYSPGIVQELAALLYNDSADKIYAPTQTILKMVNLLVPNDARMPVELLKAKQALEEFAKKHPDYVEKNVKANLAVQDNDADEYFTWNMFDQALEKFINEGGNYAVIKNVFTKISFLNVEMPDEVGLLSRWFELEKQIENINIYHEYKELLQNGNLGTVINFVRLLSKVSYRFPIQIAESIEKLSNLSKAYPETELLLPEKVLTTEVDIATDASGQTFVAEGAQNKADMTLLQYAGTKVSPTSTIGPVWVRHTTGEMETYSARKIDLGDNNYLLITHTGAELASRENNVVKIANVAKKSLLELQDIVKADANQPVHYVRLSNNMLNAVLYYMASVDRELGKLEQQKSRLISLQQNGGNQIITVVSSAPIETPAVEQATNAPHQFNDELAKIQSKIEERKVVKQQLHLLIKQSAGEGVAFSKNDEKPSSNFLTSLLQKMPKVVQETVKGFRPHFIRRTSFVEQSATFLHNINVQLQQQAIAEIKTVNENLNSLIKVTLGYIKKEIGLEQYTNGLSKILDDCKNNPESYKGVINIIDKISTLYKDILTEHFSHVAGRVVTFIMESPADLGAIANDKLKIFLHMTSEFSAGKYTVDEYKYFLQQYLTNSRTSDGNIRVEFQAIAKVLNYIETEVIAAPGKQPVSGNFNLQMQDIVTACSKAVKTQASATNTLPPPRIQLSM